MITESAPPREAKELGWIRYGAVQTVLETMEPAVHPNNSQFTEEERTEAFRTEIARFQFAQTKALQSIRGMLTFIVVLICIGLVVGIIAAVSANTGS